MGDDEILACSILRLRGLPYNCAAAQLEQFFGGSTEVEAVHLTARSGA
jgi:hypothetical protein